MLEAKVALLAVALLLGQDDEDVGPDMAGPAVSAGTGISYQFAQTNRQDLSIEPTTISAESGFVAPSGGYSMLRIFIDNARGPRETISFSLRANLSSGASSIRESVEVLAGERRLVLLPVPSQARGGMLEATIPGSPKAESSVYFATPYGANQTQISIGTADETERFLAEKPTNSSANNTISVISAAEAPSDLVDWLGISTVLIPRAKSLEQLNEAQRAALESYVAAGGRLLLPVSARSAAMFPLAKLAVGTNPYGFGEIRVAAGDSIKLVDWERHASAPVTPQGAPLGYRTQGPVDLLLPQAHAPLGRFLLIITAFALLIGPGSVWVARRRGAAALLITIPSTAFMTCMVIIGYSAVADGFTVHSATYGYTILDRARNRAITVGVSAYYANLSPREARYSSSTGVVGAFDENREQYSAGFEWKNGQHFGGDFLPSRTYREWGLVSVEPSRARLTVARKGEGLVVRNALGAQAAAVMLVWDGKVYSTESLADGAEAPLVAHARVTTPLRPGNRFTKAVLDTLDVPLKDGEFVAELDGTPFVPTGGLDTKVHEAHSVVRGTVDQ